MKILLVIPSLNKGGAERAAIRLVKEFSRRHEVILFLYRDIIEYPVPQNVKLIVLKNKGIDLFSKVRNTFIRIYSLKRILKKENPDIFISFLGNLQPILTGEKVIVSIRNNPKHFSLQEKLQLHTIYRFPNVEKIVAVSRGIARILKKEFHLTNVDYIYNPIDLDEIKNVASEKINLDFPYILSVGRLHPQKNFLLLIKAFAKSKLKNKYKLIILGEGSERHKLENLINHLGLKNKILLPGKVDNPFPYMKKAKFFVMSSNYEGFPNVLLEALACGTPVISTNCPTGPDEIIQHKKNGLLVPVGDEKSLTRAMEELDEDEQLYNICKNNAIESVKKFDVKLIAKQWEKLFEEVLNND